ncbi:MAG TPA: hypothetical protein VJ927_12410, partial [Actinomycetota bacterium]|nr:hypothetical protein [Actinomycetota bacterium]
MKKLLPQAAILVVLLASVATAAPVKSDNVKQIADLKIGRITELAMQGDHFYAVGEKSVSVIDRESRRVIGALDCEAAIGGTEVESLHKGFIAFDASGGCGVQGVAMVDVRDPKNPRLVGGSEAVSSHTITAYPGKPIVYVSPNGCCGDLRGGIEEIVDFRNPTKPKIVEYRSNGIGCHDVGFLIKKDMKLAACAGGAETQLWDVSDPLAPVTISRIPTPQVFFNHSATISPDGNLLVVGDEAHGVTSCTGIPTGALWFYDISNPAAPILLGYHTVDRGSAVSSFWATPATWCTAHMYNFKPGTRLLATAWYQGGINVLDLTDPSAPVEVGFYQNDGQFSPWAAYWDGNRIWTADEHAENGGVEIFDF